MILKNLFKFLFGFDVVVERITGECIT